MTAAETAHRKHWEKRWSAPRLDRYMGGRGLGPQNKAAVELVKEYGWRRILEIGPGSFRFLRACDEELTVVQLAAVELPLERARKLAPPFVEVHWSWTPYPLPWPNDHFDVVYQMNAIPNMPSSYVEPLLDEIVRVAPSFVWGGEWRSRPQFWEGKRSDLRTRGQWMHDVVSSRFSGEFNFSTELAHLDRRTFIPWSARS